MAERRWGINEDVIAAPTAGESEALDSEGVGQDEVVPVEEPEAEAESDETEAPEEETEAGGDEESEAGGDEETEDESDEDSD